MFKRQLSIARLLDLDDESDSSFQTAERKGFAGVFVPDRIHGFQIRIRPSVHNAAADLNLFVRILEIDNRHGHARLAARVLLTLQRIFSGADDDALAFPANPYRDRLWRNRLA